MQNKDFKKIIPSKKGPLKMNIKTISCSYKYFF